MGSTGVAKIIISKHDGGSPSIKAKVTLQKPGEGSGDSLRPQIPKSYGSPLISGSTPKHERCSPSHNKSPAYTPQTHDSESESGSSSIAEKSYQNSPSSDDGGGGSRAQPEYSAEKHKKHKKEKKRLKDKDRDREKKKTYSLKPENWSKSPVSSDQTLSMGGGPLLSSDRAARPSPTYLMGEDDDLMDVALLGN